MSHSPTSKKFGKSYKKFDIDAFEQGLSNGEAGLTKALENLKTSLFSGGTPQILNDLLNGERSALLFEYTFSIIDDDMATRLREGLLAECNPESYAKSPLCTSTLDRLANFLWFYLPEDAKPQSLKKDFQFVQSSRKALSCLASAEFDRQAAESLNQRRDEEDGFIRTTKPKRPKKQTKPEKRMRKFTISVDPNSSSASDQQIPPAQREAEEVSKLLTGQKELLGRFLDTLREPSVSNLSKEQFMLSGAQADSQSSVKPVEDEPSDSLENSEPSSNTSAAYPFVQPLKASLYFDSAEGFGEWRIFMSTTAIADLRGHRKNRKTFDIILKKIRELSNGFFSVDNQKRLKGPSDGIPVFEAKLTSDLRLVYQVDCVSDFESKAISQAIRVYGIFTHAQMDNRMWGSVSAQLATRGEEYRSRITFRRKPQTIGDNVYRPQSWPDTYDMEESVNSTSISSPVNVLNLQSVHQWLVLEKYSALSQALLNCIVADKDSSPVFSVSPRERDIVEHPSSCYVLGRSGTGKTTTMAFKMFGIERTAQVHSNTLVAKPRQLFVTQSHVLASRVNDYYAKLSEFLAGVSGVPHMFSASGRQSEPSGELGVLEDDEEWRSDLPKRFSQLQESHFPLFVTFNKLCGLIEADWGVSFAQQRYTKEHKRAERRFDLSGVTTHIELVEPEMSDSGMSQDTDLTTASNETSRGTLVTFELFCNDYWPHFPQHLSKNLDPAMVFSEILGVIKGSKETLNSKKPFLSRQTYLSLSERTRSTFATQRDRLYSLFEKYMMLKRDYGDYDDADRSHTIIRRMNEESYDCSVDFLYVDEAQDNLIIDAFLLRRLCRNPHGLFWAGDTAQTIAIGSSFRFDDLTAALHSFERILYPSLSGKAIVKPEFFQLTTNFRSHGGIVNCAEIIIGLITHFWPHSIDALKRERGLVDGLKPVFFTGWDNETARYEQFLLGENGSPVEFGARQCILVRNDRARTELRKQVGDIGLIMTLYESKGLEFDDVLLFNFFKDSSCVPSQWRTILNFLDQAEGSKISAPRFDDVRHAGLCMELKFLYVAVTRARKNLWLIDQSEKSEPMKTLLLRKGKIVMCRPENAPKLAEASSPKEWAMTGRELFSRQRYPEAIHCFERANLPHEKSIAEAYHLRYKARNVPRGKSENARDEAFLVAARTFSGCAKDAPPSSKKKYYRISAECFREGRADELAARSYENAEEYTSAAIHYRKANMFDEAVRIVQTEEEMVEPAIVEKVIGAARLYYTHVESLDKARRLFDAEEDFLEFMDDCGFDTARVKFLEKIGKIQEAAELHHLKGRTQKAIELLKDDHSPRSTLRAADYLLRNLWRHYSYGVEVPHNNPDVMNSVSLGRDLDKNSLTTQITEELDMFDALKEKKDKFSLLSTYENFHSRENLPAITLILDHILCGPDFRIDDTQTMVRFLRACLKYAEVLRQISNHPNPSDPGMQRLFGFEELSEEGFLVANSSFLASRAMEGRPSFRSTESGIVLSLHDLLHILRSSIKSRLRSMVHAQVLICNGARNELLGEPCLTYAIYGRCSYRQGNPTGCHRQHVNPSSADAAWFDTCVRIHLLQISFLQTADFAFTNASERSTLYNRWLTDFFNVLNPPLLSLGSMANLHTEHDAEFSKGMNAVAVWVENRAYQIDPNHLYAPWFLNSITEVATLGFYQDRHKAKKTIQASRLYTGDTVLPCHSDRLGQMKVRDLIRALDTLDPNFIRSGCTFIFHVIKHRLTMDVGHLCRLVELLAAASIILYKDMRHDFHDCLLPKSWLAYLLPRLDLTQKYNTRPMEWLINQSTDLAHYMLSRTNDEISHLRGTSSYIVRNLSVQRICRAVCLVGYNTTYAMREHVLQTVIKLQEACRAPPDNLLRPFLSSRSWPRLRRAAESSLSPSALDEMVQLVQIGHTPRSMSGNARVIRINFKDMNELPVLVSQRNRGEPFKMSATAAVFVPTSVPARSTSTTIENDHLTNDDIDNSLIDDEADGASDDSHAEDEQESTLGHPAEAEAGDDPVDRPVTFTITFREKIAARILLRFFRAIRRRKEEAARTFQRTYRAMRERRDELRAPGVRGKWARFHGECVANGFGKKWASPHHRAAYYGLVPHLLVCLEILQVQIQSDKDKAKRQLRAKNEEVDYDLIDTQRTKSNDNRKRLERLKKRLEPKSEWHITRTLDDLKSLVLDISTFIDELKVNSVDDNIRLVVEALDRKSKGTKSKSKEKPSLNVEDLDPMW